MHWQLFFPRESGGSKSLLERHGMEDLVEHHESAVLRAGPEGPGLLVGWKGDVEFDAASQTWEKVADQAYWIGLSNTKPCRPNELSRNQLFAGYGIPLDDGQRWQIPAAAMLPQSLRLVDRQWTKVRKPRFDEFWRRSEAWYRRLMLCELDADQIMAKEKLTIEELDQEWTDYCVFVLRQNYRVTPEVVSRLGLFDEEARLAVTNWSVDGMRIREVLDQLAATQAAESAGLGKKKDGSTILD